MMFRLVLNFNQGFEHKLHKSSHDISNFAVACFPNFVLAIAVLLCTKGPR